MNDNATSGKEASESTRKNLRVIVCTNGVVNVRNPNSKRGHSVVLDERGTAVRCSCKGYRFHGHCYHTSEIESRPLIVASARAASNAPRVATDGGTVAVEDANAGKGDDDDEGEQSEDTCRNGRLACAGPAAFDLSAEFPVPICAECARGL